MEPRDTHTDTQTNKHHNTSLSYRGGVIQTRRHSENLYFRTAKMEFLYSDEIIISLLNATA